MKLLRKPPFCSIFGGFLLIRITTGCTVVGTFALLFTFSLKTYSMSVSLLEKLQLQDERNLLIQGLPSSIEKQFVKLSFAKNVTPLLRSKKIDFALVFAVNQNQLNSILKEVLPALANQSKFWVAYPKASSKIVSDLNREGSWQFLCQCGFETSEEVTLDHVWTALRFDRAMAIQEKPSARTSRSSKLSSVAVA